MRTVDLPGAIHLVRPTNVRALDPAPVMFVAMLEGWSRQQRSRLLAEKTVRDRLRLVRRFAEYTQRLPRGSGHQRMWRRRLRRPEGL